MSTKVQMNVASSVRQKSKYQSLSYWASKAWSLIHIVLVIGICFIIINPILVKLSSSIMTEQDLFDVTVKWVPKGLDLQTIGGNYRAVYDAMNYPVALFSSTTLALLVAILQTAACTVIGYGLARYEFAGRNLLFALVIFTLLVPPQMVMIPLFLNFRFFNLFGLLETPINLIGTYWPFVLTSLTGQGLKNGLFIYIMRQFFKQMPKSLEEAALVDGAGEIRIFTRIMLPGATSALVIVFLFSFVWQYNDVFLTSMYMRESSTLLPFMLERLSLVFDDYSKEYISVLLNTGMLMFIAPILILYAFLQKYFVESVERTGIVG